MARPGLPNKKTRGPPSIHSRAARRATSPSIDTDKSLKELQPPSQRVESRPSVLAAHHGAGVNKKTKRGRKAVLSAKARRRQEKDSERAEAIYERTAQKVERSKNQAKGIKERRKTWDEVNKMLPEAKLAVVAKSSESEDEKPSDSKPAVEWETDEEMDSVDPVRSEPAAAPFAVLGDDDDIL